MEQKIHLIPGLLDFAVQPIPNHTNSQVIYFSTCLSHPYLPKHGENGPINISSAMSSFEIISYNLQQAKLNGKLAIYTSLPGKREMLTSISTICLYLIICLNTDPETLYLKVYQLQLLGFDDEIDQFNNVVCRRGQCPSFRQFLEAASLSQRSSAFNMNAFSYQTYNYYMNSRNGCFVELLYQKLFAFQPNPNEKVTPGAVKLLLSAANVLKIISLDSTRYDGKNCFNLCFGAFPTQSQLSFVYKCFSNDQKPFAIFSQSPSKIALIQALILMKFYGFSALQAAAWARVMMSGVLSRRDVRNLVAFERQRPELRQNLISSDAFANYQEISIQRSNALAQQFINTPARQVRGWQKPVQQPKAQAPRADACRFYIKSGRIVHIPSYGVKQ